MGIHIQWNSLNLRLKRFTNILHQRQHSQGIPNQNFQTPYHHIQWTCLYLSQANFVIIQLCVLCVPNQKFQVLPHWQKWNTKQPIASVQTLVGCKVAWHAGSFSPNILASIVTWTKAMLWTLFLFQHLKKTSTGG